MHDNSREIIFDNVTLFPLYDDQHKLKKWKDLLDEYDKYISSNYYWNSLTGGGYECKKGEWNLKEMISNKLKLDYYEYMCAGGEALIFRRGNKILKVRKDNKNVKPAKDEAEILAMLADHIGVVRIYNSVFPEEQDSFSSMELEYVEGETLKNLVSFNKLNLNKTKDLKMSFLIFSQATLIFSNFQKRGILHGDITPGNVILNIDKNTNSLSEIKIIDFGLSKKVSKKKDKEIRLKGFTPSYVAPEIYMSYKHSLEEIKEEFKGNEEALKMLDKKMLFLLRDDSSKVLGSLSVEVLKSKIFKSDVFSFGVTMMGLFSGRLAEFKKFEIMEQDLENPEITEKLRKSILEEMLAKILVNPMIMDGIKDILKKMVAIEPDDRPDFIELENYFIYNYNCPLKYYKKLEAQNFVFITGYDEIDFNEVEKEGNRTLMSLGWKTKNLSDNFLNVFNLIKNDIKIENINSPQTNKVLKESINKEILEILKLSLNDPLFKSLKNKKPPKEDLLEIDSCYKKQSLNHSHYALKIFTESNWFSHCLNLILANNRNDLIKNLTASIIFNDFLKNEPLPEFVYRGIRAPPGKSRFDIARSYELGRQYFWPSFVSTTANKKVAYDFMKGETSQENALFKIKLMKDHYFNKRNIQKLSQFYIEEEILLFPSFSFVVKDTYPSEENSQRFPIIELEELDNSLYRVIIWVDQSVNNMENKYYQDILSKFCRQLICFSTEEEILKYFEMNKKEICRAILIISGKMSEKIIGKVHNLECLSQIFVFAFMKTKYEFLKEKFTKIILIEEDFVNIINKLNPSTL